MGVENYIDLRSPNASWRVTIDDNGILRVNGFAQQDPGAGCPMSSGMWYLPFNHAGLTTVAPSTNNRMQLWPIVFGKACLLNGVGLGVTVIGDAACKVRLGLYSETDGKPTTLVQEFGQVAGDVVASPTLQIACPVDPIRYWYAVCCQGAATTRPTMRAFQSISGSHVGDSSVGQAASVGGFYKDGVTAALPALIAADGNLPASQQVAVWHKAA